MAKYTNQPATHANTAIQGTFDQLMNEGASEEPVKNKLQSLLYNLVNEDQKTDEEEDLFSKSTLIYTAKKHSAIRTEEYLYNQLIPYIGNKRKLLWLLAEAIEQTGVSTGVFVDLFAGSSVVSRLAKTLGFCVLSNDWEPYSKVINHCYIECNRMPLFEKLGGHIEVFQKLNNLQSIDGYIATHLCPVDDDNPDHETERMFFTHINGGRIDAIREQIRQWEEASLISDDERAILLGAMMYSVSYVSNTSGVFKGFHRGWGGNTRTALYRILSNIGLRIPVLYDNQLPNKSYQLDAQSLATQLQQTNQVVDIAYIDPPYNQHPYASNYHVLNTVTLWDKPELNPRISGRDKAAIRLDWRTERRSAYNHSNAALDAYRLLINTIQAKYILTSYSTDGNISVRDMLKCAAQRGQISCVKNAYKRYRVSSQRMSVKPINVEFVLIIDTHGKSACGDADSIYEEIMRMEQTALASHKENQPDTHDGDFLFDLGDT